MAGSVPAGGPRPQLARLRQGLGRAPLATVSVAGELPETAEVLVSQRRRWATGTGQSFRGLPWSLVRHLRADRAAVFALLSLQHVGLTIAVPLALAAALGCWLVDADRGAMALGLFAVAVALIVALKSIGAALASRVIGRSIGTAILRRPHRHVVDARVVATGPVQGSAARSRAAPSPAFHAYTEEGIGTRSRRSGTGRCHLSPELDVH